MYMKVMVIPNDCTLKFSLKHIIILFYLLMLTKTTL